MLRGPNGTGKTTALEALWPYLLDLDSNRLAAGKARPTTLKLLMSDGAPARGRRYGYAWLTFAVPDSELDPDTLDPDWTGAPGQADPAGALVSFGVRLQYAPNSTPAVRVTPFTLPGRPGQEVALRTAAGGAMEAEEFKAAVATAGGTVFDEPDQYVENLAGRVWSVGTAEVTALASRLREVRNPTLLGAVTHRDAAAALRQSLPGVDLDVLAATADALAESEQTREAFERDERAAVVLGEFEQTWTGHVVDVTRAAQTAAVAAATELGVRQRKVGSLEAIVTRTSREADEAAQHGWELEQRMRAMTARAQAIAQSAEYKAHGRVIDLRGRLVAEEATARSALAALRSVGEQARRRTDDGRAALADVIEDLTDALTAAAGAGADPVAGELLLAHHARQRATRRVGEDVVDPGPGLNVHFDAAAVRSTAAAWQALSGALRTDGDRAQLLRKEHGEVAVAAEHAHKAARAAEHAEERHDEAHQSASAAARAADGTATDLLAAVRSWAEDNPGLRGVAEQEAAPADQRLRLKEPDDHRLDGDPETDRLVWDSDDIDALDSAEPGTVLAEVNRWAQHTLRAAEATAARHEAAATAHVRSARDLHDEARELFKAAAGLRAGELMPLPRPDWAGAGDDDDALGALLEWSSGFFDPDLQARVELALAAAGVLGARLDVDGASTDRWAIGAHADSLPLPAESSLSAIVDVDSTHRHAATARAVVARIRLADTAEHGRGPAVAEPARPGVDGLTIGRDGTFAVGPLTGRPARAYPAGEPLPQAGHVGARARLESARARADLLDAHAAGLEADAAARRAAAGTERAYATAARAAASRFPGRDMLVSAEAGRATTAKAAQTVLGKALRARSIADEATAAHARRHAEWVVHARDLALPADVDQLTAVIDTCRRRSAELTDAAEKLTRRVLPRIGRVLATLPEESALAEELARVEQQAQGDAHTVYETRVLLAEAQSVGDVDDAVQRYERARGEARRLEVEFGPAREDAAQKRIVAAAKNADLDAARERVRELRPRQVETEAHLRRLLDCEPVAAVLDVAGHEAGHGPLGSGDDLMNDVESLLAGRRAMGRKALGDRYDAVRADVAQTWTIAREEESSDLPELEMFVLTHADMRYDPHQAAVRSASSARKAREALDREEARALQDFVIGRLPAAVGTAWVELLGWRKSVNVKMRSAQASSGVGVQVDIALRDDLDATTRTVYELSCEVGDAVRTDEQKAAVGQALLALLAAADGETMTERLASAIDIRNWVDVHYLVERPGQTPRRWGSRTGLSGGERRLVVLAPMLAAVAANYDRMGPGGLRLVALDEVPAEVDETGREGLARFIAELDLDVLCTSYLWDGAPGAWDGIDAHDLEAGPDGTVVAFPMLVRGADALPGDTVVLDGTDR